MSTSARRSLPKDPQDIYNALDVHMDQMENLQARRRAMWWLIHHYLQGYRSFEVIDFVRNNVQPKISRFDIDGNMEVPIQLILQRKTLIESRMRSARMGPAVTAPPGGGLEYVRKKAMATALLEATLDKAVIRNAQKGIINNLLKFGSTGLRARVNDGKTLTADLEVIHPQNVFPWPYPDLDLHNGSGLIHRQYIEFEQLREMLRSMGVSDGKITAAKKKMRLWDVPWGAALLPKREGPQGINVSLGKSSAKTHTQVAELREVFIGCDKLERYVVQIGEWIPIDEERDSVMPLTFHGMYDDNNFWSQGLVEMAYGVAQMFEQMLVKMVQNVKDLDLYGYLVLPRGYVDPKNMIYNTGNNGPKIILYDKDPMAGDNFKVDSLAPVNAGTLPGQVASGVFQTFNDLIPISKVLLGDAPGRVDSTSGLQFLSQQADLPLAPIYEGADRLLGNAYRWIVEEVPKSMRTANAKIPITRASEELAGLVMEDGEASLMDNPLNDTVGLSFHIQDSVPNDLNVRKREALELTQQGIQEVGELRVLSLKEGLNLPIGNYQEQNAWAKEGKAIMTIFNDGETPGEFLDNPMTLVPAIQLQRLMAFMAGPEFMESSPAVQEEFFNRRVFLETELNGGVLP